MSNAVITTSSIGSSGLKSLMTLLADGFIASIRNRGRIVKHCNTNSPSSAVAAYGDTARVLLAPDNVAAALLTDGSTKVLDDSTGTSVDVVLNKHRVSSFGYTQIAQALDGGRSLPSVMDGHMKGLLNAIESDIAATASTFSTNTIGTFNSNLTESTVVQGMGKLFNSGVPEGVPLTAFVHQTTTAWQALIQIAAFREFQITGKVSPLVSPEYGTGVLWHNANWIMSQNVKTVTPGTTSGGVNNFIFAPDAICVAMKALPLPDFAGVEGANFRDEESGIEFQILRQWNKDTIGGEFVLHALYGVTIGKDGYGLVLKS